MITEDQILAKLDDYKLGHYCQFIDLGHVYSYLIDSRLNIFKGDMSFVGPRALLPNEMEVHGEEKDHARVEELFRKRSQVTPGLTGIAQIFAPRDVPRKKKFRYDLLYIKKQSFLFDLRLIFLSFWITFRGKWESRENKIGTM